MITDHDRAEAMEYINGPALSEVNASADRAMGPRYVVEPALPAPEMPEPRFAVRMSTQYEVFDRTDGRVIGGNYDSREQAIEFAEILNKAATAKGRWQ